MTNNPYRDNQESNKIIATIDKVEITIYVKNTCLHMVATSTYHFVVGDGFKPQLMVTKFDKNVFLKNTSDVGFIVVPNSNNSSSIDVAIPLHTISKIEFACTTIDVEIDKETDEKYQTALKEGQRLRANRLH